MDADLDRREDIPCFYIQLYNLDLQPCFVDLSTGRPSWLVESDDVLLQQVKYLTHFVVDSSAGLIVCPCIVYGAVIPS